MANVDFVELAIYCANRYKEAHTEKNSERYVGTLYVCIAEDNSIMCSKTPHILRSAHQCILIHERSELAISNWYSWYRVEFINDQGCVFDSNLGDDFNLSVSSWGNYSNQRMSLTYGSNNLSLYQCKEPFEKNIYKVWELYTHLKDLKTISEIKLIADLFQKNEKIFELENQIEDISYTNHLLKEERDQYKNMLDEIKEMIDSKK